MAVSGREKLNNFQGKKIAWISFIDLDRDLHKTSRLEILKNLAKLGHNTCLVAVRSKNVFQDEISQVRVISIPLKYVAVVSHIIFNIILILFLPLYIAISKPDFIITEPNSIFGFIPALLFSKFKRTKFVLDIRSTPVETVGFIGFLQKFCFSISVFMAKGFFNGMTIITSPMRDEVCKRFSINPKLVGVWSSGVSTTLFKPEKYISQSIELRRNLGLSKKFIVYYHGYFSANRGLTETVEAMSIVKRVCRDVVFFLIGTGPIVPRLKKLVQKADLRDNVIIHDPVNYVEISKYVAMCDVGIVPLPNLSYWRFQCPLKLLEYLAMKKVVIVTDILAHRYVIGKEKCGIYISSVEPTEIARAIIYAYENKENLVEWGATGRKIVNRKYTWRKIANHLESYLLCLSSIKW